jgi:hypothetical protein
MLLKVSLFAVLLFAPLSSFALNQSTDDLDVLEIFDFYSQDASGASKFICPIDYDGSGSRHCQMLTTYYIEENLDLEKPEQKIPEDLKKKIDLSCENLSALKLKSKDKSLPKSYATALKSEIKEVKAECDCKGQKNLAACYNKTYPTKKTKTLCSAGSHLVKVDLIKNADGTWKGLTPKEDVCGLQYKLKFEMLKHAGLGVMVPSFEIEPVDASPAKEFKGLCEMLSKKRSFMNLGPEVNHPTCSEIRFGSYW